MDRAEASGIQISSSSLSSNDSCLISSSSSSSSSGTSDATSDAWDVDSLVVAGQAALVLGCLSRDHSVNLTMLIESTPCVGTSLVCRTLEAFLAFQNQAKCLTTSMMEIVVAFYQEMVRAPSHYFTQHNFLFFSDFV